MKYSQKTLHSSPERARYGVSFVSSKGNILCRLVKIELYKIFAIINRAIKGLHCTMMRSQPYLIIMSLTVVSMLGSLIRSYLWWVHPLVNTDLWRHLVPVTVITVETLDNTINFCSSTHKRHSIARPKGRGMGCLLWVQRATYCVDLSKLSSIKYLL